MIKEIAWAFEKEEKQNWRKMQRRWKIKKKE